MLNLLQVFCLLLTLFLASPAGAEPLGGAHFEPTSGTLEMGAEWQQSPFRHTEDDAAADLVVIINQQFDEILRPVIAEFARQNQLTINVYKGTCGLAAGALLKKAVEIASFCCPPGTVDRLPGLKYHTLGIYPISILVHPDNPVEDLSWKQIQQVFRGQIRDWSEVNGTNEQIRPIIRLHCKKRPGHWRLLLDNQDLFSVNAREVGSIDDMYALIAEHTEAIGYEVSETAHSQGTKPLTIDGMAPADLDNLLRGAYPFYRVLNLTLWQDESQMTLQSRELLARLTTYVEENGRRLGILSAGELKAAGWSFSGAELVGFPAGRD